MDILQYEFAEYEAEGTIFGSIPQTILNFSLDRTVISSSAELVESV